VIPDVRHHAPLLLHALLGAILVPYVATAPCGSDECLGPLYAVTGTVVWLLTLPVVVVSQRAAGATRLLAWVAAVSWVPVAGVTAFVLFVLFPSLGGA
jgi:hypothetical protein